MSIYSRVGGGGRKLTVTALRKLALYCLTAPLLLFSMSPLSAHHSRPEYDRHVQSRVTGTVKEFQLINPHAWIHITVTTREGAVEDWSFEGGSVGRLNRVGWSRDLLKPGESIIVLFNPKRDGSPGGLFRGVTTADGKFYSASRERANVRF